MEENGYEDEKGAKEKCVLRKKIIKKTEGKRLETAGKSNWLRSNTTPDLLNGIVQKDFMVLGVISLLAIVSYYERHEVITQLLKIPED